MSIIFTRAQKYIFPVLCFLIPTTIFVFTVFSKIPPTFSQLFQTYTVILFFIIVFSYFLTFRLPEKWSWLTGLSLTMLIFGLTLSHQWTSGFSNNLIIGGLLPYKDGFSYYTAGVQMLLNGIQIPPDGLQATGRPLFPGFLSSLLFFSHQNLQYVHAIITAAVGFGCYWAARQLYPTLGSLASAIYMALLYFYIQPLIGTTMSELPGFLFGCLGFVLLWKAARKFRLRDLIAGLIVLILAISIRAGAFFIVPLLVLWAGWAFRGEKRFSYRIAFVTLLTALVTFTLTNVLYPQRVVAPGGTTFGNFAYTIYGQVLGGAGWHRAIEDTQTHDSGIVYAAALEFFLKHPTSLMIGIAKSYRDFFLPGDAGVFSFYGPGDFGWINFTLWGVSTIFLLKGMIKSVREIHSPTAALLSAGWIGIFLSIPFLPPVDGGRRFYASTMAFFFAVPVFAFAGLFKKQTQPSTQPTHLPNWLVWGIPTLTLFLTSIFPVVLLTTRPLSQITSPSCPAKQLPYITKINPGSYIDLLHDDTSICGLAPALCLKDFKANGAEKNIDDFYEKLITLAETDNSGLRVIPGINFIDRSAHYFVGTPRQLKAFSSGQWIRGCASQTRTSKQSIYKIQTVLSP